MANRDFVRVKSVMSFPIRAPAELFALTSIISSLKFMGGTCASRYRLLACGHRSDIRPAQDEMETEPRDFSSDFRLERRLCECPEHSGRRTLAGRVGAARAGLSRRTSIKRPRDARNQLWRACTKPLRSLCTGRPAKGPGRFRSWRILEGARQELLVASRARIGGKRLCGGDAVLHAVPG